MGSKQSSLAKPTTQGDIKEQHKQLLSERRLMQSNEQATDIDSDERVSDCDEIISMVSSDTESGSYYDSDYDSCSDSEAECEDEEVDLSERLMILNEMKQLKALATAFLHPEAPVSVHPTSFGHGFFSHPSAIEQENVAVAEEQAHCLKDVESLKTAAFHYLHPEVAVITTDVNASGRNYFSRPSAIEQEDMEASEERAQILADAMALKQTACDYAHPEISVITTDVNASGRNYFSRPSAIEQEDMEASEERAQILADAMALKQTACDYAHPEISVTTTDVNASGRNYFSRPSAPVQEDMEESEEHIQVLADAMALKQTACDYAHPEISIVKTIGNSSLPKHVAASMPDTGLGRSPSSVLLFGLDDSFNEAY